MTDQMTRAAEILEGYAEFIKAEQADNLERHPYIPDINEAARILRAADAVDVQGLMAMHDAAAEARRVLVRGGDVPRDEADRSRQTRAALESALRLALAAREGFVMVPVEPTPEMMDAARSLTSWPDGIYRAMTAAAPKGTYPQEDRSREPPCHACGLGYKCRSANCPNTTPDPMTGPHRKEHHDQP